MKKLLLLFFCVAAFLATKGQTLNLWTEIDPAWKIKSNEYFATGAYSKASRKELTDLVNEEASSLNRDLSLKCYKALLESNLFESVDRPTNPTQIYPGLNDIYVDVRVRIEEISESYPYFKKGNSKYEPKAVYETIVIGSNGVQVAQFQNDFGLEYKTQIKDKVKSNVPTAQAIEEYALIIDGTMAMGISAIVEKLTSLKAEKKLTVGSINANLFNKKVGVLFEERKNMFPEHYANLSITYTQVAPTLAPDERKAGTPSEKDAVGNDPVMAMKLAESMTGVRNYGLFIGVNDYEDPKVNDLENPINDAKLLMNTLSSLYTFEKEDIIILTNPTRNEIIQTLDEFAKKIKPKDNFLIFYAGHGVFDQQLKSGYWLPRDAKQDNRANWLSNSSIRDYIGGINSKHTLLIADACFSGGIFKTREAFTGMTKADLELYKLASRKAMTSGAMKTVPDKSVFIEYLVKRLAENNLSFVSSEYLFSSFKTAVINNSANGQVPQFGEIRETGDEGGDFIFVKRR